MRAEVGWQYRLINNFHSALFVCVRARSRISLEYSSDAVFFFFEVSVVGAFKIGAHCVAQAVLELTL